MSASCTKSYSICVPIEGTHYLFIVQNHMKTPTKKMFLAGALALGITAITGAAAFAATPQPNPMDDIVTTLSTKFNLNKADVQKVFDDSRTKMEASRTAAEATRLADAVKAGTLTQAQSDVITAKKTELLASRPTMEGKTKTEIMTSMKTQRTALDAWAKSNNLPTDYMKYFGGHGEHAGGHRGFGMKGKIPSQNQQ